MCLWRERERERERARESQSRARGRERALGALHKGSAEPMVEEEDSNESASLYKYM